jgi:hypothetical protein
MGLAGPSAPWTIPVGIAPREPGAAVPAEIPTSPPFPDEGANKTCACGHALITEHGDHGLCLYGCAASLCSSSIGAPPEEGA